MPQQVLQQVELGGGEADLAPVDVHPPADRVERERPGPEQLLRRDGRPPPQHGPDPGDQLARAERLGDVVVRAELEAQHPLHLVVARGDHQHRGAVAGGPQRAQHLQPVQAGQPDVEHDRDRALPAYGVEGGAAVGLDRHREALAGEVEPLEVGDVRLVLDHQDEPAA